MRRVKNRRERLDAVDAEVAYRECPAREVIGRDRSFHRLLRQRLDPGRKLGQGQFPSFFHHRRQQALLRVASETDVDVRVAVDFAVDELDVHFGSQGERLHHAEHHQFVDVDVRQAKRRAKRLDLCAQPEQTGRIG